MRLIQLSLAILMWLAVVLGVALLGYSYLEAHVNEPVEAIDD